MQQNENRKYHIFGTVPKFNRKKSLKEATSMPLAHKYMIDHFLSLVQAPQEKRTAII
jgi:hypothetical protein